MMLPQLITTNKRNLAWINAKKYELVSQENNENGKQQNTLLEN